MMDDQLLPAFISALLTEGVDSVLIERAVAHVQEIGPGKSITGNNPVRRLFAFEQARLLRGKARHGI